MFKVSIVNMTESSSPFLGLHFHGKKVHEWLVLRLHSKDVIRHMLDNPSIVSYFIIYQRVFNISWRGEHTLDVGWKVSFSSPRSDVVGECQNRLKDLPSIFKLIIMQHVFVWGFIQDIQDVQCWCKGKIRKKITNFLVYSYLLFRLCAITSFDMRNRFHKSCFKLSIRTLLITWPNLPSIG